MTITKFILEGLWQRVYQILSLLARLLDPGINTLFGETQAATFFCPTFPDETFNDCFSAFSQMALQLTMHRLTGGIVPTYESASTRRCAKETCVDIISISIDVVVVYRLSMLSWSIDCRPSAGIVLAEWTASAHPIPKPQHGATPWRR